MSRSARSWLGDRQAQRAVARPLQTALARHRGKRSTLARVRSWSSAFAAPALGMVLVVNGLLLAAGGAWLIALGGSFYYLPTGVGLLVSGGLLWRRRMAGAYLYLAVFAATSVWAWWEVGTSGWALMPRLLGPAVLLVLLFMVSPTLSASRRFKARTFAIFAICMLLADAAVLMRSEARASHAVFGSPFEKLTIDDPSSRQTGADWPVYGGTSSARRYSPLDQINRDNVGKLQPAWTYHTGDLPGPRTVGAYASENTPLKIGDTLFLCTPKNILIALDASSGTPKWRFDPKVPDENIGYSAICRGVVYFSLPDADREQPCATRIIEGTLDARLIAVDARTGTPCGKFGSNGEVDTTVGIGEHYPGTFSITSPPTIVRGVIVVGHQVLDGQKRDAPSGVILGYDAITGKLRWAWDMAKPDAATPPAPGETYTRGTPNMWAAASGDEALGLAYLPLGSAAVDYWSGARTDRENDFATSLVALDVLTGKPVWHFQTVHNDVWDYDLGSQASLVDFPTRNGLVPALVLPTKRGDMFVLDRRSGRALVDVEERPVPQGGVEPEQRSKTQPFSLFHTLSQPDLQERDMWGMSPLDQLACRIKFRRSAYRGMFTPPSASSQYLQYPGSTGGSNWGGVSVDPVRGIIIANYSDMANYNRLVPREEADRRGWRPRGQGPGQVSGGEGAGDPQFGAPFAIEVNAGWRTRGTLLMCKQPPYGGIRAIDLATGTKLWDRPLGQARRNGPFGIPSMLPIPIGTPNNGGSIVTASGLVFIAASTDNLISAIDIETGKTLWSAKLPAGGQATPMTYQVDGRQYLAIMAGGHRFMETPVGDALVTYALPNEVAEMHRH